MSRNGVLRVALLPAVVALAVGCSSGRSGTTGRVSDVSGRLCLQTTRDNGTCFGIAPALLATVKLGDCVHVDYSGGGAGREPAVSAVRRTDAASCPHTPRPAG